MPVEYNYAGIWVDTSTERDYDEGIAHISFSLAVSE